MLVQPFAQTPGSAPFSPPSCPGGTPGDPSRQPVGVLQFPSELASSESLVWWVVAQEPCLLPPHVASHVPPLPGYASLSPLPHNRCLSSSTRTDRMPIRLSQRWPLFSSSCHLYLRAYVDLFIPSGNIY